MAHKHIFNLLALASKIKNTEIPNVYHRVNTLMKGGAFTATPELIEELETIVKDETKKTLKYLSDTKKQLQSAA